MVLPISTTLTSTPRSELMTDSLAEQVESVVSTYRRGRLSAGSVSPGLYLPPTL